MLDRGLRSVDATAGTSASALPDSLRRRPLLRVPIDTVLFRQDDQVDWVYVIDAGLVRNTRMERDGTELTVGLSGRGSLSGCAAALFQEPHRVTAVCATQCEMRTLTMIELVRDGKADAELQDWILRSLAEDVRRSEVLASIRVGHDPIARLRSLAALMPSMRCERRNDRSSRQSLRLRAKDLAAIFGVTPQHFSRLLDQWERDGLVVRGRAGLSVRVQPTEAPASGTRLHKSEDSD